ncbi:uncharacterized protein LOC117112964 [Anneissia japonica]|uniref:uncharacterized protein LOC117112964 n=1 Tax=Anneissia japonica TaxID=1529436 RepID=UPI0014259A29|nr:uncharacterized protein LOC117112964 [Anneissia japonica]
MKFKTVLEGQQAIVTDHLGKVELIVGPQRVFLYRKRLTVLRDYTANRREYLVIHDKDGLVTHKPGPCQVFLNPYLHESIKVEPAIILDGTQLLVVYKKSHDNVVTRRLVNGPQVFIPEAEEWFHEFTWHGPSPDDKTKIVKCQRKFTKLTIIPENMYYNVTDVRTQDDTTLTLKIMLFYELKDAVTMLTMTHDPIADLINALCADVVAFAANLSYAAFLGQSSDLSCLKSYPQLIQRAERIGFEVNKVVYRGYQASSQLQNMQDNAIKSRTQLRLNTEVEEREQKLVQFRLQREEARSKLKQERQLSEHEHAQALDRMTQEHDLQLASLDHHQNVELTQLDTQAKLELEEAKNKSEEDFLRELSKLKVDMTKYLVNQHHFEINKEVNVVNLN